MAADIDVGYVAGHLGIAPDAVSSAIIQPTPELVIAILQAVAAKAIEAEQLFSEKLRVDIELENAVRISENRCQASKANADKALQDAEDLRQKLGDEETARLRAESELQSLRSNADTYESEVASLRQRIETLQDSSRANLNVVDERNSRIEELSQELTQRHQKNMELNRELSTATLKLREAESAANTARYREESLKQQLELATRNRDWFENELKEKNEEAQRLRRDKTARIAELTRLNEEARNELESLRRSEQQLRERLAAAQAKADDLLVRSQKQQESFAKAEESYKQEIRDSRRLAQMSSDLSGKHQARVSELEREKERLRDDYENEIHRVRVALEKANTETTAFDERVQQLEAELDDARARIAEPLPGSVPHTPRHNGGSASFAVAGGGSPFATPGSIRKNGLSVTQALDEYYKVKGQLVLERRRNVQLQEEVEQLMTTLEAQGPETRELQDEVERLRADISRMSELSQEGFEQRDSAKKAFRLAEAELANARVELDITKTQLRDLGIQVRMLVFNLQAQEKGLDYLTPDEQQRFSSLAAGELADDALADMSETDQFITRRFIVYRDVHQLQKQNEELTRMIREISRKMQQQEELIRQYDAAKAHETIERLERELAHMLDEAKSMKTTMDSYKAERDMFRRLLQQKVSATGELVSVLGSSFGDGHRQPLASIESGPDEDLQATAASALRQQQALFDEFRTQQAEIRQALQQAIDELKDDKNRLQAEVTRLTSQEALTSQRHEMLQSNYKALQSEIGHVQESNRSLSTNAVAQDNRLEALSEELVSARNQADSLQKEASNLRTEKELWQGIHARLAQDNDLLTQEKGRLNGLVATTQTLLNERDIADAEYRRTAQTRIDALETELASTRERLAKETEESRQLQQRKEYETRHLQDRIDKSLESVREKSEHIASLTTTRDHLQARVNELTAELRNAEDRFGRLLPRATPRAGGLLGEENADTNGAASVVQDLRDEIEESKRELDAARSLLENATEQLEHQKDLGRNTEEALESATEARDAMERELRSLIDEKTAAVEDLTQRVTDLSAELSASNGELSRLRDSQGEVARRHDAEKALLEEANQRFRDEAERHAVASRYHQQDLRSQAEIAAKAQQDYEVELVKHAEAAKQLQTLRTEHNAVRGQLAKACAEAEAARMALEQNEASWDERQSHYADEIAQLRQRREDLQAQNRLLHEQLDGLARQVSAIQQTRSAAAGAVDAAAYSSNSDLDGLRELNNYLRREKEIIEVQLDIRTNEAARAQGLLDAARAELDELRLKLEQERRAHAESGKTSVSHKELMDKLHELNLYRESSAALRTELEYSRKVVAGKTAQVDELTARVQPLRAEIEGLQVAKRHLEEEIAAVQKDRDGWQKRTESILTKYDRVDPAEMEQLNQKIADLEAAGYALRTEAEALKTTLETERVGWAATREKLVAQFKERSKRLTGEKNEAIQRANEFEQQFEAAGSSAEAAAREATAAREQAAELERQVLGLQARLQELQEAQQSRERQEALPPAPTLNESDDHPEQQLAALRRELDTVASQKTEAENQLRLLQALLQKAEADRNAAVADKAAAEARAEQLAAQAPPAVDVNGSSDPITDEERGRLQQRAAATESMAAQLQQRVSELEASIADAETRHADAEDKVRDFELNNDRIVKERSEKMKVAFNDRLRESRAKLEDEFALKLEQERAIWKAENVPPAAAAAAAAPSASSQPAPDELVFSTPTKTHAQGPDDASGTSSAAVSAAEILAHLPDPAVRHFIAVNATAKAIIANNIKKRVETDMARLKAEYEPKIAAARESGEELAKKRSALRINMAEKRFATVSAKLTVVETAAAETPQKPVVEVWAVAKVAVAQAPAPPQAPPVANATATTAPPAIIPSVSAEQPNASKLAPQPPGNLAAPSSPAILPPTPAAGMPTPSTRTKPTSLPYTNSPFPVPAPSSSQLPLNPFAVAQSAKNGALPPNPFSPGTEGGGAEPSQQAMLQQAQVQALRTGIPMLRGGRGGGGSRAAGATYPDSAGMPQQHSGRGGHGRGRGGGIPRGGGGGGGHMNPAAQEFLGNKRQRGDADGAGAAKRPRGA